MNTQKKAEGSTRRRKIWGVRILALSYFTALMTFTAPPTSVKAPTLRPISAEAEELNYKDFAAQVSKNEYGWGDKQMKCLRALWGKESAWNPEADNPISTAFGIAQMLNETSTSGFVQIRNGLRYILSRYETPCNAWDFWLTNGWY